MSVNCYIKKSTLPWNEMVMVILLKQLAKIKVSLWQVWTHCVIHKKKQVLTSDVKVHLPLEIFPSHAWTVCYLHRWFTSFLSSHLILQGGTLKIQLHQMHHSSATPLITYAIKITHLTHENLLNVTIYKSYWLIKKKISLRFFVSLKK